VFFFNQRQFAVAWFAMENLTPGGPQYAREKFDDSGLHGFPEDRATRSDYSSNISSAE
jgi:hypothetical protein